MEKKKERDRENVKCSKQKGKIVKIKTRVRWDW